MPADLQVLEREQQALESRLGALEAHRNDHGHDDPDPCPQCMDRRIRLAHARFPQNALSDVNERHLHRRLRDLEVRLLNFTNPTELTIASGVIAITQTVHSVDTESDTATDELDHATGGAVGDHLVLLAANVTRKVVIRFAIPATADQFYLRGQQDIVLGGVNPLVFQKMSLPAVGDVWVELGAPGVFHKWNNTTAPGVTNDIDEGYSVGSTWIDTTADKAYVCLDVTDGAAVWTETTGAGGGSQTPWTSDIDGDGFNLTDAGVIFLREQAEADADVGGAGQIWVDTQTPNVFFFTDDAGTDHVLHVTTTRGDLVRRGASIDERFAAVTAGAVVGGDGTDVVATVPKRTILLSVQGGTPTTTGGCATPVVVEAGTNDVDYWVADFNTSTDESMFWIFAMPNNWDGGTVTFRQYWTAASGSGTFALGLKGRSYADSDAIDQAYGTEITATDTLITAVDVHIGPESSALTLAGGPAGGELVQFKATRKTGSDTLGVDARLMFIKLIYTLNSVTDA